MGKLHSDIAPAIAPEPAVKPLRQPTVVVRPSRGWAAINLRELWAYRDLLLILAGRDIRLRYKQTALGVAWVVLQPLIAALIFAVIFGRFAGLPSDGIPYVLFVFCGLLPWNYFSSALQRAGNSLIADAKLISKIYFPRLLIPLASTIAVLIDFGVMLVVLCSLLVIYQIKPSWQVLGVPFFLLLVTLSATGISLWLSALNVQYRDFMYATPFLIQVWMYASPVVYPTSIVPQQWRWLYSLNPVVGVIEGFRWSLLGRSTLTGEMTMITTVISLAVFLSGALFFRRIERRFADVI
jgi:lipopolysaccharide transport system permease protein